MMKKVWIYVLLLGAAVLLALTGCAKDGEDGLTDEVIAGELGTGLVNTENGLTAEMNDAVNVSIGGDTNMLVHSTVTFSKADGTLNAFAWDAPSSSYRRSGTNITVTAPGWSGTITSFSAQAKFYTTSNASGAPVQLVSAVLTNNPTVRSMTWTRTVNGTVTGAGGVVRTLTLTSSVTVTGLNDGIAGVTVSGTRTVTCHRESSTFDGDWTLVLTFNGLHAERKIDGATRYTALQGTVHADLDGTFVSAAGRVIDIARTANIAFSLTRTVTVTVNDASATFDIATGLQIQ